MGFYIILIQLIFALFTLMAVIGLILFIIGFALRKKKSGASKILYIISGMVSSPFIITLFVMLVSIGKELIERQVQNIKSANAYVAEYGKLNYAIVHNETGKAVILIMNAKENELRNVNGTTPLMLACSQPKPNSKIINALLNKNVDVNARDNLGRNVVHYMMDSGDFSESFARVLECGADVNCQDKEGDTALIDISRRYRYIKSYSEKLDLLLEHGANTNLKNKDGKTALDYLENDNSSAGVLLKQKMGVSGANQ